MGEKYDGSTDDISTSTGIRENSNRARFPESGLQGEGPYVSNRSGKWVYSVSGGVASALVTTLLLVIPVINTWLENTKQVQVLQVKNTSEQVEYITKRMIDSDKERDLYKSEMLQCQKELRELKK